jgi:uncharacterized membrane protein
LCLYCGQDHVPLVFNDTLTEVAIMRYLLEEALPLTVPYSPDTLSTISYHPVKVRTVTLSLV